uniref:Uncharacterized protein n=1 Tax=Arundo donax TaxID=35708 RepID=A0A0A8Y5D7_ARUDO
MVPLLSRIKMKYLSNILAYNHLSSKEV